MFNRISIWKIIASHWETLYDDGYYKLNGIKKTPKEDIFLFLAFPTLLSLILSLLNVSLTTEYINILLTCLSIFAGLLFGLLSLVLELIRKFQETIGKIESGQIKDDALKTLASKESNKLKIGKELFVNIAFEIIVSLFTIIVFLISKFKPLFIKELIFDSKYYDILKCAYYGLLNFVAYFLLVLFLLTMFMVLKKFHLLYENETS